MPYFTCKNCGVSVAADVNTVRELFFNFHSTSFNNDLSGTVYKLVCEKCTNCDFVSVRVEGSSEDVSDLTRWVIPSAVMRHFPDYVPVAIRADYEEACAVIQYSPKSSATLSRRCLEGILKDFFGIQERTLFASLEKLKPLVSNSLWKAIDALRKVGNMGAHMQQDVNILLDVTPNEASLLLKLLERLIDGTYVARHDDDALFTAVSELSDA